MDGKQLADRLKGKYREVTYNASTGSGRASSGMVEIAWIESGNDTACWVSLRILGRQKTHDVEAVMRAIATIEESLNQLG